MFDIARKKRYDIEPLPIDRVFNKKDHSENVHQRVVPDPLLILKDNQKQSLHARNSFRNKHFERGLSKSLTQINFISSFKPSAF